MTKNVKVSANCIVKSGNSHLGEPGYIYLNVPASIKVLKCTVTIGHTFSGDNLTHTTSKKVWVQAQSNVPGSGQNVGDTITKYVGVTPGKQYILYFNCQAEPHGIINIDYSEEINKVIPDFSDLL